jgi:hypothetical protein|tara:strand:+ start:1120 stop:1698 length:579 start_codon:yes stop_codon:yes gene_type:complete
MEIKFTDTINVFDDFLTDKVLINKLKKESKIDTTIKGQDTFNFTPCQKEFSKIANATLINYCLSNNIDYNNLELSNFQKGRLKKYDKSSVTNHLYEPHHDQVEGAFISAIYYIDSDYTPEKWVGGELSIYKNLTFAEYPNNTINIEPIPNRLIMFPGFLVHRVKPYFGENPRTSLVLGWEVKDQPKTEPIWI